MNLGKLLGSGKSFINGGKSAAYRKDKRVYLPKFGSPKNPFAGGEQGELPQPPATETPEPAKKKTLLQPWVKTVKMPTLPQTPKPAAKWTSKLNPVSLWRTGQKPGFKDLARPVQTELSLEKVKVVHNDLTDADVEVVPMKSRPAREPAKAGAPDLAPAREAWEILGERMLEAKNF